MARPATLLLLVAIAVSAFAPNANAFYLPGVAPRNFLDGEPVELKVNKIVSSHTQLPYSYYDLPVCKPDEVVDKVENLGEVLSGDRIESSSYEIRAGEEVTCAKLCTTKLDKEQIDRLRQFVVDDYRVRWVLDNLPAATPMILENPEQNSSQLVYDVGFWLGGSLQIGADQAIPFVNNYHAIKIRYHTDPAVFEGRRVVGFEVDPQSVAGDTKCKLGGQRVQLKEGLDSLEISWMYSVTWEEDETPWANRWDRYFFNTDPQIHWFAIINSLMIVLFLTGMVATILVRALNADIRRYNSADADEEAEETGWKLVHGDVFRPPQRPLVLAVLVGSGAQLFVCSLITLGFALLGFLSPANRGGLVTAAVVLFVMSGLFAGYHATRIYKSLGGTRWRRCAMFTATSVPGFLFIVFFIINLFIWGEKSSGAVPFGTLVALCALWCGISVPLVYLGSYFADKKPTPENPVRTNTIPRPVPEQVWYLSGPVSALTGGVLPFGAVFIELFFIMTAIWGQQYYYLFGILFLVFVILVVTSAEIAMVMTYFQLCAEDYHWWWRSFFSAGSSAVYMFFYAIFYFYTKLEITNNVAALIYFGYSFIMSFMFFILTGSIGFLSCWWFVSKIFGNVKVD
jgi:transmembrane 9 superfamily member 2/4